MAMFLNRIKWARPLQLKESITSNSQVRCIYSGEELGIKKYEESRKVVNHAIANHMFFKQNFSKQLMNIEYNLTQLEYGLKNFLHIMNNNSTDIRILRDALRTLIHRQKEYEGDKYRFDTIVMRAFYYLNMPNEAIEFFEDEVTHQLFKQVTGYQILLDLLYENEKYADVIRIYNELHRYGRLYQNKYIDVIILATYYRLNTPDALEKAYDLWCQVAETRTTIQFRKSRTFVAGLAVKQNQSELALKILEGETTYVTMRHIKLLAWTQLGQFDKVFEMFRSILKRHEDEKKYNPLTSIQILNDIERALKHRGSDEDRRVFRSLRNQIESKELTTKQSLDELLCTPFPILPQANIYHKKK